MLNEVLAGNNAPMRAPMIGGVKGDGLVSEYNGRFYSDNIQGNIYCGGESALTSISNATYTVADLSTSGTPIIGLYNPLGSGVNAVILQAVLSIVITALQNTGCGSFVWATSLGNGVVSTGNAPLNMSTLQASGSKCKDMSAVALTGLTNTTVVRFGSVLGGGSAMNASELMTAVGFMPTQTTTVENWDGGFIVPPGGVAGLFCSTTPVAHSAVSRLMWSEKPIAN